LATEGGLVHMPLSTLLARRPSQNLVATIDPRDEAERTLCLVCHLDTSRSGLMFHPRAARRLNRIISVQSAAVLAQADESLLASGRAGRAVVATARTAIARDSPSSSSVSCAARMSRAPATTHPAPPSPPGSRRSAPPPRRTPHA
jgi:hypothetical protein